MEKTNSVPTPSVLITSMCSLCAIIKMCIRDRFYLGELFYMYEFACGISGYILGVNPFNQPGVESYKKNMFALLGKPGYEELTEELQKRL